MLGRPCFLSFVVVLAVNDHILKARFPGTVTGKLSDFAGPLMVATVIAVVAGRNAAVIITGAGLLPSRPSPVSPSRRHQSSVV